MNFQSNNVAPSELSIQQIARVKQIFEKKNWPIVDDLGDGVFDNLCRQLAMFDVEQRDLLISLTEKFLWVRQTDYIKYFSTGFDQYIHNFAFNGNKKIYLCPALPEKDFGKSKSSISLLYSVKSNITALQRKYQGYTITYADSPLYVNFELIINQGFSLCLIDDFVGTGETAISAINYFLGQGVKRESIAVVSLVSMEQGVAFLNKNGYNNYTCVVSNKGISDTLENVIERKSTMESIESFIQVEKDFKFGYGASEALVKMERTPNNTFPVYWYKGKKNKFAPFPR